MAIAHYSAKIVSRGAGQSVIASLAYIEKDKKHDERLDLEHDYSRQADEVKARELVLPQGTRKYESSEEFWNAVEKMEKRKDAQLAQRIEFAVPREFTPEQNRELCHDFFSRLAEQEGRGSSWALHDKNGETPHPDALITLRAFNKDKAGEWGDKGKATPILDAEGNKIEKPASQRGHGRGKYKTRWQSYNGTDFLNRCRRLYQDVVNEHLERANLPQRIDVRKLSVQLAEQMQFAAEAEARGDYDAAQKHMEAAIRLDRTPQRKEYNRDSNNAEYNRQAHASDAERQKHELDTLHKYVKRAKHDAYYKRLHARKMFTERTRETLAKKYGCEPTPQSIGKAIAQERIDTRRADMFADLCAPTSQQTPQHELVIYKSLDELMKRESMTQDQLALFLFKTKMHELQKKGIKLDTNKQNRLKRSIKHGLKHGAFDKCAFVVAKPLKAAAGAAKAAVMPIKATKQVLDTIQSVARCIPIVGKPLASAVGVAKSPVDAAAKVADAVEKVADKTQRKTRRRQEPEQERPQRGQQQQGNQGNDKQSKSDGKDADAISADGHIQGYDDLWDVDLKFVSEMERDRILAERERAKTI